MVSWVVMVVVESCAATRGAAATRREAMAAVNFILGVKKKSILLSQRGDSVGMGRKFRLMRRNQSDGIRLDRALRCDRRGVKKGERASKVGVRFKRMN